MIIERLGGGLPVVLSSRLQHAVEFLGRPDIASLASGRHDLDGERLFALVSDYTTKLPDEAVWEAHRTYIDIQFVASGIERIGYQQIASARERVAYDSVRDVTLFHPGSDFVTVPAGTMVILGPADVHAPGIALQSPSSVRKIVIKAAV